MCNESVLGLGPWIGLHILIELGPSQMRNLLWRKTARGGGEGGGGEAGGRGELPSSEVHQVKGDSATTPAKAAKNCSVVKWAGF